jgi:hypothetical protein
MLLCLAHIYKQRIQPVKSLIDEHLKNQNIKEIHKLIHKYNIRKSDIKDSAKLVYLDSLKTDRNYAVQLRSNFELSVFDVGFFNWLFYEVIRLKSKI